MDAVHESYVRAKALQRILSACQSRPELLDPALINSCARLAGRLALWAAVADEHEVAA